MMTGVVIDMSDDVTSAIDSSAIDSGAIDIVVVTMQFDAIDDAARHDDLRSVLSKYVVLARMESGCRNVDLISSVTHERRHLVIEKWDSPASQRRHFDSAVMVEMATGCAGLLAAPPRIDLWEPTSAHDLR
jgi:quinol monooxygenase YgiN